MKNLKKHKISLTKLSFGGELININVPDLPFSIVSAWFNAGSRFDFGNKEGLAHFFEHLLTVKTKKFKTKIKKLTALESKGIFYNAYTTKQACYYYQIQLPEQMYDSLNFLIDGLQKSIINESDLKKEKEIIIDEKLRSENDPQNRIWFLNSETLFSSDYLGRNFFGSLKSINSINLNDIFKFQKEFYFSGKTVFIVIGNEPVNKIKKFIENRYSNQIFKLKPAFRSTLNIFKKEKIKIEYQKYERVTVGVNFLTTSVKNFEDYLILNFLSQYLANHWTSRLIQKLRIENDFTYWVDGSTEYFSDTGFSSFVYSVNPKNLNKSLEILFSEIKNIKNRNISESILNSQKIFYESSLVRRFSDPYELLWWYGYPALIGGKIISPQDYIIKMKKITSEQIKDTANKYFIKENIALALIGPIKKLLIDLEKLI